MRLNDQKIKYDMLGEVTIEECPKVLRSTAENILKMLNATKAPDYNTMSELDKRLTLMYWFEFDGLLFRYQDSTTQSARGFEDWYVDHATSHRLALLMISGLGGGWLRTAI